MVGAGQGSAAVGRRVAGARGRRVGLPPRPRPWPAATTLGPWARLPIPRAGTNRPATPVNGPLPRLAEGRAAEGGRRLTATPAAAAKCIPRPVPAGREPSAGVGEPRSPLRGGGRRRGGPSEPSMTPVRRPSLPRLVGEPAHPRPAPPACERRHPEAPVGLPPARRRLPKPQSGSLCPGGGTRDPGRIPSGSAAAPEAPVGLPLARRRPPRPRSDSLRPGGDYRGPGRIPSGPATTTEAPVGSLRTGRG